MIYLIFVIFVFLCLLASRVLLSRRKQTVKHRRQSTRQHGEKLRRNMQIMHEEAPYRHNKQNKDKS